MKKVFIIILIVTAVAGIGAAIWYFISKKSTKSAEPKPNEPSPAIIKPAGADPVAKPVFGGPITLKNSGLNLSSLSMNKNLMASKSGAKMESYAGHNDLITSGYGY